MTDTHTLVSGPHSHRTRRLGPWPVLAVVIILLTQLPGSRAWTALPAISENRMTPIVAAVARVKESTVNIHTEKRSKASDTLFSAGKGAAINGMGTGVVVDERGYIATNHHVVDGVESLRVTLVDGASYDARVVSYDSVHDLAIIKIDPIRRLQVMPVGTSSDLLLGEDVLAIGNAFGYEHTVTKGIISALSRDVEVNEQQSYQNLIQIDAAINPGNSGGPLLNRDGEVIGINVAIRAGAQKIGFAIPIDDARRVIARLINIERLDNHLHGLQGQDVKHGPTRQLVVAGTTAGSPAADAGLQAGDIIVKSGTVDVIDMADFERSLLGRASGEVVPIIVRRGSSTQTQNLTVDSLRGQQTVAGRANVQQQSSTAVQGAPTPAPVVRGQTVDKPWSLLGLKLASLSPTEMRLVGPRYHGGMKVQEVRHESPAFRNGIREGDILVGLHVWETVNSDNIEFVVTHPQLHSFNPLKFYILRGNETLYGYLQVDGNSR